MSVIINEISTTKFSIDGINYYKNFTPIVRGNYIEIVNTYDSKIKLCEPTLFGEFTVDGSTYASVSLLQDALLPVLFTRGNLGGGGGGAVDSVNGETGVVVLTEEDIIGTAVEDITWTGTEDLDLDTFSFGRYILTGNTTITTSNAPSVGESKVINLMIASDTTETLTLPVSWVVIGEFVADGTENYFSILFSNTTTEGSVVVCYINQA